MWKTFFYLYFYSKMFPQNSAYVSICLHWGKLCWNTGPSKWERLQYNVDRLTRQAVCLANFPRLSENQPLPEILRDHEKRSPLQEHTTNATVDGTSAFCCLSHQHSSSSPFSGWALNRVWSLNFLAGSTETFERLASNSVGSLKQLIVEIVQCICFAILCR